MRALEQRHEELQQKLKDKNKFIRAFTLIEMMVVLSIIAVLAAILLPNIAGLIQRSKRAGAQQTVHNTYTALVSYMDDKGQYPWINLRNRTYRLRDYLRDYATWSKWGQFLRDPWDRWMSYHRPDCYGYVGAIYSNGPNGSNQTWSCWWWRYRGFRGDDIGKSIKQM